MGSRLNERGFTLIELTATLVIFGVIMSVGIVKYDRLSDSVIEADYLIAVRELNVRESLTYFSLVISPDGYIDDPALFGQIDYDLGAARWTVGPAPAGGQLEIQGIKKILNRQPSSKGRPAEWKL